MQSRAALRGASYDNKTKPETVNWRDLEQAGDCMIDNVVVCKEAEEIPPDNLRKQLLIDMPPQPR